MHQILQEILASKKTEVAASRRRQSEAALLELCSEQSKPRPFATALIKDSLLSVIAEIKKASPSAGVIREDFNPVEIAQAYEANGASAISILTDRRYFQGELSFLARVHRHTSLPILRKDFMIDPYQVLEARAHGADAILLIMAALSDCQCVEIRAAALEHRLDFLVEVHTEQEIERALNLDFEFIGINNRDLNTFNTNLRTTEQLVAALPANITVVSESGMGSRADLERMGRLGVHAVLVGESFMRATDPGKALEAFVGVPRWSR